MNDGIYCQTCAIDMTAPPYRHPKRTYGGLRCPACGTVNPLKERTDREAFMSYRVGAFQSVEP